MSDANESFIPRKVPLTLTEAGELIDRIIQERGALRGEAESLRARLEAAERERNEFGEMVSELVGRELAQRDLVARWYRRAIELDQKVVAAEALIERLRAAGDALAAYSVIETERGYTCAICDCFVDVEPHEEGCELAAWRAVSPALL